MLRFHFPEHKELNAALLTEGEQLRSQSEGVVKSNQGGWHSAGNLFDHDAPSIKVLRALAQECVHASMTKIGAKADLETLKMKLFAWMNVNPSLGYNAPHAHPGAHWSGVYYVSQPEKEDGKSGMIEFLSPRVDLHSWRILDAPPFRTKKRWRPMPGDMVLFPSYLMHWVYPNETEEERVTIAFNATFRKAK